MLTMHLLFVDGHLAVTSNSHSFLLFSLHRTLRSTGPYLALDLEKEDTLVWMFVRKSVGEQPRIKLQAREESTGRDKMQLARMEFQQTPTNSGRVEKGSRACSMSTKWE